jgi:glucose-6-phosphate 1-dehydrogenase
MTETSEPRTSNLEPQALPNALRDEQRLPRVPDPGVVVIFGASGDLTARKLVPALYELAAQRRLPMEIAIVGLSRTEMSHDEFRDRLRRSLEDHVSGGVSDDVWESFASGIFYLPGDSKQPETYDELKGLLKKLDEERGTQGNRAFYLSTSPSLVPSIVQRLGEAGMNAGEDGGWSRLVVEKPFGRDLESAKELNAEIQRYFDEGQIYRIDHYLGKETVQNILALRFANGIFEPIWNQHYVDHVQITVAEDLGVGTRGAFYEEAGAMRDIVQNHVMQVLCLTAMEPPVAFDAESLREEKVKVLKAVRPIPDDEVDLNAVRGQYTRGWVFGEEVEGYREGKDVASDSVTETFVGLRLFIDNWRWAGVPFFIRSGKRMPKKATEVAIQFHSSPHTPFAHDDTEGLEPNVLVIRVQPEEGLSLKIGAKVPGTGFEVSSVNMDLLYGTAFLEEAPDAYQRLLLDLMLGDPTLFIRADEAEGAWRIIDPIMRLWAEKREISTYPAGTWGPEDADQLLERDGREWRRP